MDHTENIERFLRARLAAELAATPDDSPSRVRSFVTISRESGTGGHHLADTMLEVFDSDPDISIFSGWRVYDRKICELVAADPRFTNSLETLIEEEYRAGPQDFFHQIVHSTVDRGMLMDRVFLVVRVVASMGKAIIIGRGGSQVTSGMPHGVSLRLVAPDELRVSTVMERYGATARDARAEIKRRDAGRQRMMRRHFGVDIASPENYDATWNLGSATYREIAGAVRSVVDSRSGTAAE